jgi:hypothetical protein
LWDGHLFSALTERLDDRVVRKSKETVELKHSKLARLPFKILSGATKALWQRLVAGPFGSLASHTGHQ